MIYEKYPELKYKYRNREFWCRGYYVDTAGKNAKKIVIFDKNCLKTLSEYVNFMPWQNEDVIFCCLADRLGRQSKLV